MTSGDPGTIGCKGGIESKGQLQSKLNIEGFTWADAGSTEGIADGIEGDSESVLCVWSVERIDRRREIDAIKKVVHFGAELKRQPLAHPEVLEY